MTLREALAQAQTKLADSPNPRLDAESLLLFALHREGDRAYLLANPELVLDCETATLFWNLVTDRASSKPMQYITGHQEFFGLDFLVTPDVLIPRPETEHSVEAALALAPSPNAVILSKDAPQPASASKDLGFSVQRDAPHSPATLRILDVGTGSGCIAIALAHALPHATVTAVDISSAALAIARRNAARNRVAVEFLESDLCAAVLTREFDLIVSNPPYIGTDHPDTVQRQVKDFEPAIALWGGASGLELYRRLIPQAHRCLAHHGSLVLEIGYSIADAVRALFPADQWSDLSTIPDLQGIPRVVTACKR